MGFLDFDKDRFFDVREMDNYKLNDLSFDNKDPICLGSESRKRSDLSEPNIFLMVINPSMCSFKDGSM